MGLLGAIGFSLILASLTQIQQCSADECKILSTVPTSASSIQVKWQQHSLATGYLLDTRKKNSTDSAPIILAVSGQVTDKTVQGLKPGTEYNVTLKVMNFFTVQCVTSVLVTTVPDTSQILEGSSQTSTSVTVKWSMVPSAQSYILEVYSQTTGKLKNFTFTNTMAVVGNLQPSTNYDCYVLTVNQAGMGSRSKVRTITTLVQPPVGITATQTGEVTARVTWIPVENVLSYLVIVQNLDDPTGQPFVRNVTDTKVDVPGIEPCSNFLISVSSYSKFLVPSEPTNYTYTTNKLTPVSSVWVDYTCNNNSVRISWSSVFGAKTYMATAMDENRTQMTCTSQGTGCEITGLKCSQHYVVNVTPVSDSCRNLVNATTATFQTASCPPSNLMLFRECHSDVIKFSWNHTSNAEYYLAKAVDSKGVVYNCLTGDNFCDFTRTLCGRLYSFTVQTTTGGCTSESSSTVSIQTAPCMPQNLQTSASCSSDVIVSTWDLAEGALRYTVNAEGNFKNSNYSCSSQTNSCAMEGVRCGESLTITIKAFDNECASPMLLGYPAETVPCTPQNVSAIKDCGSNSITVSWVMNSGALFYVAIVKDSNNVIHSCNSMDLSCKIKNLKCATNYEVYVVASNFYCNSSESNKITLETANCPPSNLTASLNCASNEALISWTADPSMKSFTATMTDENSEILTCTSLTTSCKVSNLKCGHRYSVSATYFDGNCSSMPSESSYMQSVPCGPDSVLVDVDCASGGMNISWSAQKNAEAYMAVISDSNNQISYYNTTEPKVIVHAQECGQEYTVKVKSFTKSCVSFPTERKFREAPCVPTNVVANRNCGQKFVDVTWQASRGATNYTVAALDENGNLLKCVSNQTSCRLEGLTCDHVYNISVAAVDDLCSSMKSLPVKLTIEPCPPSHLTASVNCTNNSAKLNWNSSPNAVSYTGKGMSSDGHIVTCEAGLIQGCELEGLLCGKEYSFTVSASDGNCQTIDSEPVIRKTAPCAVQNVLTTLNCETNALSFSWGPGSIPMNYSATAVTANGTALQCITQDSSCTITGLQCGQQYTVRVKPISGTCEGQASAPEIVNSAPCVPMNVQGTVDCSTNMLQASWGKAAGAVSYTSTLKGAGTFSTSCSTASQSCIFSQLQCAQSYSLSVVAVNDRCNSSKSAIATAKTAPCDPTNVVASLNCLTGVATVTWTASTGASHYSVLAETNGYADFCNSTGTSCELTKLQCGKGYTVTVMAGDGKCNSSTLAKTNITTAPCAPVIQDYSRSCNSSNTLVTWTKDKYTLSVMINATSSQGHSLSCSSSTNNSCFLDNLLCGHFYTVQAVAKGVQCSSKPSSAIQIAAAPCTLANVKYQYSCGTGTASVSWNMTLGQNSVYVRAQSGNHSVSCSTSQDTSCSLPALLCSRTYNIEVTVTADNCSSAMPAVAQIQTAPCAPTNISASLLCENNTAKVSWQPSPGVVSYSVNATGGNGEVKQCTTNTSTCLIPNMNCGQTYTITVSPYSNQCKGQDSQTFNFVSGPCPPTNILASLQCAGNIGYVTWNAALRADLYMVKALSSVANGHVHNCSSSGTSCFLTDLNCGGTVAITVVTIERGCQSQPSSPLMFKTAICPPSGVIGETTCNNNDITVRWNQYPEFVPGYFIRSLESGGVAANSTTSQTFHALTGLKCGKQYTFEVATRDFQCTSVFSKPIQAETAPCPPTNLTVKAECGTSTATLAWAPSAYAISYTATLIGTHGHVVYCSANTTTCSAKVDCGRQYSAVVVAFTATCNSSQSANLTFASAPCLPEQVQANLSCSSNSFAVQWKANTAQIEMYTALAIGSDNSTETCGTLTSKCTIQNLKCGLLYGIVVTTSSVNCETIGGSDYHMYSAPCMPNNVSVDLQCSNNKALVTWGNSGPDQNQVVTAVDSNGLVTTCNSSSSNCVFDQLSCGKKYLISVVSYTNSCRSEPTVARELTTAPCVPTNVTGQVDCNTGVTGVTWTASLGATSYTVYAKGSLGHNAECTNTNTYCNFPSLVCGQDYTITVMARHPTCASLVSNAIIVSTAPCPYTGLNTSLDCSTNTFSASWTPGSGNLYYIVTADAVNIADHQTCSTNSSSCNISSLRCGEMYRVSISGQGKKCPSPVQSVNTIIASACPPTQLKVNSSCASNGITVSWLASKGSASYMAVAENAQGRQWSCNTSSTTCQISNLMCGQEVKVYVAGINWNCIGAKSEIKTIHTVPCVPENIQTDLDCLSGVLNITWQVTGYFRQFYASVVSSNGQVSSCLTDSFSCVVSSLQCEMTYSVAVMAQNEVCNSSLSPAKQVTTAPCPLSSFLPVMNCGTGVVTVTWTNNVAGVVHTVYAADALGHMSNCSGTNSCNLRALSCGSNYSVTITPSRNGCVGRNSSPKVITTVPCVPQLLDVEMDCLSNSAWAIFNQSSGAEEYVITATNSQGTIQTFGCNVTIDGTCSLPQLMCSQNLTFTMQAKDQQCTSGKSNAVRTETAPCAPQNITDTMNCNNGTMTFTWSAVPGAITYSAMLERLTGDISNCCSTSGTSCNVNNLPCGEMYNLYVRAEGRTCNSSESEGHVTKTLACVPGNLKANVSCSNNMASMSWNLSQGGQRYSVTAVGSNGLVDTCSSLDNKCDLSNLQCGQYYTATVTAEDIRCKSKPSNSVRIKTVPCTPTNTSSKISCEANSLTVSWSKSAGADSYIATFRDSNGQRTTCQGTTEGSCNVTGLGCGQVYHVSVVSSDGYCESPPTPVLDTPSVPCKARQIEAKMDCYTRIAQVSWYPSDGGLKYAVLATTASGHNVSCETNMTSCDLEELLCGQSYSVSVKSMGETCNSVANMNGELITEPCIPKDITTHYFMTIGQVEWDVTTGADYYTVNGETEQGLTVSCNTTDTSCTLHNMNCGQVYNITVTAQNHVCEYMSLSTESAIIMTEPCPPKHVETNVNCEESQGTISWEASWGAEGYEVQLKGHDGHSLACSSNNTFCSVEDLHCGVTYNTTVIAIGETLNSNPSTSVLLVSAPCVAESLAVNLDCHNNTAEVSWTSATGANSYKVTAVSEDGFQSSCETDRNQCDLTKLQCGQMYSVTLTSVSDYCQMETHANVTFNSRPCQLVDVEVDLQCGTRTANLYWEGKEGVELYIATATSSMGMTLQCNSTNTTCLFPDLECGETYKFFLAAYNNMCDSDISNTVEINTEPCQPTGLTVRGSCNNDNVTLDWSEAKGASLYEVTISGHLGYSASFQTNDTIIETDLPCGQLFNFTVKAKGDRCDSTVRLPERYKTGPCIPIHVESFTHCEDSLGSVSWVMEAEAEGYMAIALGKDGHAHGCITNTTTCTWNDLHCGEVYTVNVVAYGYACNSLKSNSTTIQMAPCIPQHLKSSFNCTTKVASLSWNASKTAEFYSVTAETNSGHKVQLSTNNTWTFISEFQCGQEYFLSVQAVDSVCASRPSQALTLLSEPCRPTAVSSAMNCIPSIARVSWAGSAGALFYTATVTTEAGQSNSCSSDSDQCAMPNVPCGQNHTVTVIASNNICESDPSESDILQSVPCIPTDVEVNMDCSSNQAVVSWSDSRGALSYKVEAHSLQGTSSTCETEDTSCTLTNLNCGFKYSVKVIAEDNICSSLPSPPVEFKSVPCTPNIGSVVLACYTNSAFLDWSYAEGALNYTATAQSSSGHVSTCTSNGTNCELEKLQCSQTYNVTTVASDEQCSSPPSTELQVESVPCPPEDVVLVLDCDSNTAQVEWQPSMGAEYYIVQGFGVEEHETSCETDSQSCILPDLMCGFTYNISVIAVNSVCNVSQSDVEQLQAVPCVPDQVKTRVDCESGGVVVSWEPSKGALSYTTVAQGSSGYGSSCNSSETSCLLNDLLCGLNYSITVTASDDKCSSAGSSAVDIDTVPCVPQKVTAEMMCENNTGVVSWEGKEDVFSYKVQAFGPNGHKTDCYSTKTSCELPGLHCGQLYNLTVTAQDERCDNSKTYLTLQSVPCKPTNVKASLRCQSNSAAVTWEPPSGALSYVVEGVTANGSHRVKCNNTMTYCDLSNLQCGQTYTVSVFGHDETCQSVESDKAYVRTAPCQPQNVAVVSKCAEGAMVVSWSPNPDAQYFHVAAVSNTEARLYCNSSDNKCTINNLPCGQHYNITVLSVRDGCESKTSSVVKTCSAPCVPQHTKGNLDCLSNKAWVIWDPAAGATNYFGLAQATNGHSSNCTASSSPCEIPDLKCGTLYTFHVTAINEHCSSNHSKTFEIETGPCVLEAINATAECNSDTILVEWKKTSDTTLYLVTAEADDKSLIFCNSSSNLCVLQGARCGMHYSVIVSASSDKCGSLRSPPAKIKTAPCVPSNVTVVPLCERNAAVVSWAASLVASSYDLTATGQDGHRAACSTSTNNCSLADLHCGQTYSLSIIARGDNCFSFPSNSAFKTVPCAPSDLSVDINCQTNFALLSWSNAKGAVEYFGHAQSDKGETFSCDSSNPSCTLKTLQCGNMYNFTVKAYDGVCNSSFSSPLQAGAAPCPPLLQKVRIQRIKQRHWVMISWNKVNCSGVEYMAKIKGQIGNNPQTVMDVSSYWLLRPYFELPMPCSTTYNITLFTRNSAGVSKPSSVFSGLTVPCTPQRVKYTGNTQSAVLSWDASVSATRYMVYNTSGGNRVMLCNTTGLSCNLNNFDPSTTEVTANNAVGESIPSQNITGPVSSRRRRDVQGAQLNEEENLKIPEGVTVTLHGGSLSVQWRKVKGATEYTLVIEEERKTEQGSLPPRVRSVKGDFHVETDLKSWTTYCVKVAAKKGINLSNYSRPMCKNTGAL